MTGMRKRVAMTIVPETREGKVTFYEAHLSPWAEDPASIGTTSEAVATLADLVAEARAALEDHRQAQMAARSATLRYHQAVARMHAGTGGGQWILQNIKAFAQATADTGVYARAQIPVPAKPGRPGSLPAPGKPYAFDAALGQIGDLTLTWKCDNPSGTVGTIYQVRRQIGMDGPFEMVGTVGDKRFLDHTIPPGTVNCMYEVTAMRSTTKGEPALHTMRFAGGRALAPYELHALRKLVA
jgi:hypothetical protein